MPEFDPGAGDVFVEIGSGAEFATNADRGLGIGNGVVPFVPTGFEDPTLSVCNTNSSPIQIRVIGFFGPVAVIFAGGGGGEGGTP